MLYTKVCILSLNYGIYGIIQIEMKRRFFFFFFEINEVLQK